MAAKKRPAPAKAPGTAKTRPSAGSPAPFNGTARTPDVSPEELRKLVSEAAYYRAKQRGFKPGHEVEDWVQAEAEVLRRIGTERRA